MYSNSMDARLRAAPVVFKVIFNKVCLKRRRLACVMMYAVVVSVLCRFMYLWTMYLVLNVARNHAPGKRPPTVYIFTSEANFSGAPDRRRTRDVVPYEEYLEMACNMEARHETSLTRELCPCVPHSQHGRVHVDTEWLLGVTWTTAENILRKTNIDPGGHWTPASCTARRRVAVIIPYRDRERHIRAFLLHTHPVLQSQLLEYQIFVVEQELPYVFNKGSLMNAGFLVVEKLFKHDCVLFHDVDLLMEDDKQIMACTDHVQHTGAYIDTQQYRIPYPTLLGGAVLMKPSTFKYLNGYSNRYFGWGGEDDDLEKRVMWRNRTMVRLANPELASYTALKHTSDTGNPKATDRDKSRLYLPDIYGIDGLSNVAYTLLQTKYNSFYTWIHVRLLQANPSEHGQYFNSTTQYYVRHAGCTPAPEGSRLELSRVTCLFMCDQDVTCVGIYYRAGLNTASYCILMNSYCQTFIRSNNTEVHLKPRQIDLST